MRSSVRDDLREREERHEAKHDADQPPLHARSLVATRISGIGDRHDRSRRELLSGRATLEGVTLHYCDETAFGFSWIVEEPMTRTSHALVADGRVWLIDPVDWPEAIDRARGLGEPAAVLQLLDRHSRDCASVADRLGVPHLVASSEAPDSPFEIVEVKRWKRWQEVALWWPEPRVLVVAEAVGTNRFFTGGHSDVGVHLFLRLTPPKVLARFEPEHLLVGHGEGLHGPDAAVALHEAVRRSRRDLPGILVRLPRLGRS